MNPLLRNMGLHALFAAVLGASPASAQVNALLPFWGQPYPSGYAWTPAEADWERPQPCPEARFGARRHRPQRDERCAVVLHARD